MMKPSPINAKNRSNDNLSNINLANVNSNSNSNESADLINDKTGGEISHIHTSMLIGLNSFAAIPLRLISLHSHSLHSQTPKMKAFNQWMISQPKSPSKRIHIKYVEFIVETNLVCVVCCVSRTFVKKVLWGRDALQLHIYSLRIIVRRPSDTNNFNFLCVCLCSQIEINWCSGNVYDLFQLI